MNLTEKLTSCKNHLVEHYQQTYNDETREAISKIDEVIEMWKFHDENVDNVSAHQLREILFTIQDARSLLETVGIDAYEYS